MWYQLCSAALIAASITIFAQASVVVAGDDHGSAVQAISYIGWGSTGSYDRVTDMLSSGTCTYEQEAYAGGVAPLDKEVSWHFRGPMHLKQFAYYTSTTSSVERSLKSSFHQRRHLHVHRHDRKRSIGDWVTATIDGQVQSWKNTWDGTSTTMTPANDPVISTPLPSIQASSKVTMTPLTQTSSGTPALSSTIAPSVNLDATSWTRRAYYNAETSHADGLVFLNNHGGAGSGVFDYAFGMSLSYASTDSTTAAVSPQVLADTLLNDSIEVSIWTDQQCQGEACGYYRPGTVAYHGFSGASKMFLMEFDMPFSNNTISSWEHPNPDMPAIWALNADIARTQQYGNCSCWATGCGEWDIFEAVSPGDFRLSSCVHANPSGCEGAWFQRPENKTIKAAVIFDGTNNAGNIYLLPDETDFPTTISGTTVAGFGSGDGNVGNGVLPGAVSTYAARVFDLANQGASR